MTRAALERKNRDALLVLAKRAGLRGITSLKRAELIEALLKTAAAPALKRHAKKKPSPAKKPKRTVKAKPVRSKPDAAKPEPKPAVAASPARGSQAAAASVPAPAASRLAPTETAEPKRTARLTELPRDYGKTRLVLMEIDPRHLHAYWEVAPADRDAAVKKLGEAAQSWVLRFYDVTLIQFDGTNAHSHFDVFVDLAADNWYVELWATEKTYCAEIGPRAASGKFMPVTRSNFVQLPRGEQSPEYKPEWTKVEVPATERVEPQPPAAAPKDSPAPLSPVVNTALPPVPDEPKEVTEIKVRKHYEDMKAVALEVPTHPPAAPVGESASQPELVPMPAPASVSPAPSSHSVGSGGAMFPAGKPGIDLKMNAEVVLSGRAQPGQTIQINGQWITVNPDGTFTVRLALPIARG